MKIAIIVTLFPTRWIAGSEIASYNIARNLANKGNEIHVITPIQFAMQMHDHDRDWAFVRGSCNMHLAFLRKAIIQLIMTIIVIISIPAHDPFLGKLVIDSSP